MPRSRQSPGPAKALLAGAVLGLLVGTLGRLGARGTDLTTWMAALGGPWIVAAFAAGAFAGRRRLGAFAGATAIEVGVVAYYLIMWRVDHGTAFYSAAMIVAWTAGGLPVGAALGYAGGAWRRGHVAAAGVLCGALLAETVWLWRIWNNADALRVVAAEAVVAMVAMAVMTRRPRALPAVLGATAFATVVGVAAEVALRHTMRKAGWAGA